MIHNYTGASIRELKEKNKELLFKQSWYEDEKFYDERPEAGEYEIVLDKNTCNKTYSEQVKELDNGNEVAHPAIVLEAVIEHYKKTGKRLLNDWYVRTSAISDGNLVDVGSFDAGGLGVAYYWDGRRRGNVGLSAARKLPLNTRNLDPIEPLNFESRLKALEDWKERVSKLLS